MMGARLGMSSLRWLLALALLGASTGCGDDDGDGTTDNTMMDAGMDAMPPTDMGGDGPIDLPGLDGEVEVVIDDRGMPHIYATTVHDLLLVEGYLMARDRIVQMEFIRRGVTGRLGEVLGGVQPSVVGDDVDSRFLGFKRQGEAIYASLDPSDPSRIAADSFVEGINLYLDEVVQGAGYLAPPDLEVFNLVVTSGNLGRWTGADVFALARFQSWNLSYDAGADIGRTQALDGARAAFPGGTGDEVRDSRVGIYADFVSEIQARKVYTDDGFPPSDPFPLPFILPRDVPAMNPMAIRGAQSFFDRLDQRSIFHRDEHNGSNSWVVSGSVTASGNPILSNDPHLSLTSPGVWWYVHLNTAEMGGEENIDVQGVAFAGLPGVVLGYNQDLAWSATTTGYDVTDVYAESVTYEYDGAAGEWTPVSTLFEGADVPVEPIVEEIGVGGTDTTTVTFYRVPHHGPIIPDSQVFPDVTDPADGATGTGTALSVKYTGHTPTNELRFFYELMTASTVDEAVAAHREHFQVGAQNISFVSREGDIAWSTHARIPRREVCDYTIEADGSISGTSPLFVMPGQGGYEWVGELDDAIIPQEKNPASGFIAQANQDNVGVTDDGNVCNDDAYIGGGFAVGYRMHRIVERLEALTTDGEITTADMIALQAETKSSLGETMRDPIVAALEHALGDPSDDPALDAVVTEAGAEGIAAMTEVRDRLMGWTLETPHGVDATDAAEIDDSVATTVFNAVITRLTNLAFDDEEAAIGRGMGSSHTARMLEWSLASPEEQMAVPLYTFRASYQGDAEWNDTVVWDDITTDAVLETRDERVARAVLMAVEWLESELGADWDQWRWGRLHAVRFNQIAPSLTNQNQVSIPPGDSAEFPLGFPRHGDYGAVDVGNFSMTNGERFTHGSGASQRLVVEMTPEGPVPFNALPGGQSEDIRSPFHADEAELWRRNEQPPLYIERADVEAHAFETLSFVPR